MGAPIRMTTAPEVLQQPGARAMQVAPPDTSQPHPALRLSIDQVRQEINDAFADMKTFHQQEPDYCTRICSGHSARLSELRVQIERIEDWAPEWKQLRTRELEPCIAEIRAQYEMASRLHSMREWDFKVETGER